MKQKTVTITITLLLLLCLLLTNPSATKSEPSIPSKEGNRVYIDTADAYISASPHTLTADGYVYLNITSKSYEGEMDFCFGFDGNLAYPKSLDAYDPRNETTRHMLNVSNYYDDPACQVDYNFTSVTGDAVYDGYVWVNHKTAVVDEGNKTVGWNWAPILFEHYDVGYPSDKIFYQETTETIYWTSIRTNWNFDKSTFNFDGMNTWYTGNWSVKRGREYYLRLWLTLVPAFDNVTREFFVALKSHGETFRDAVANGRFHCLDPWYNSAWHNRKSHVIVSASGAGTNYQVEIVVRYGSGTDSGENVYCGSKCKSDFGDIRFTDGDGETLLDYWLQEKTDGNHAHFWVEIADNLSSANGSIYVYYNNINAATTSNFDDTFIFGDPFDSSTLNTNRWTSVDGNPTYSINANEHYLEITDMDSSNWWNGKGFHSKSITFPEGWMIQDAYSDYGVYFVHHTTTNSQFQGNLLSVTNQTWGNPQAGMAGVAYAYLGDHWTGDKAVQRWAGAAFSLEYNPSYFYPSLPYASRWKLWRSSGNILISEDGTQRVNKATTTTPNRVEIGLARMNSYEYGSFRVYAFIVRKYVNPEPAHGAWGPEESSAWYDEDWLNRKFHIINHASNAGSDYPVRIHAHYITGVDDGEDVYLDGRCNTDFSDVRFTAGDGVTLLDYWLESKIEGSNAVFWVEVDEDLSSVDRGIYVYYANSNATTGSNQFLTGVVQLREQKGHSDYDPAITFSIESSTWLKLSSTTSGLGPGWAFIVVPKAWINGKYLRWSWQGTWDYTAYQYEWSVRIYDGDFLRSYDEDFPEQFGPVTKGAGLLQSNDTTANYSFGPETAEFLVNVNSAQADFVTVFMELRDAWTADWMHGSWDFIEVNQNSGGSNNIARIHFDTSLVMERSSSTGDYGLVRKYVNPEPAHGVWGTAEGPGGGGSASGQYASIIWGARWTQVDAETEASVFVCAAIAYYFTHTEGFGYVQNYYGSDTQRDDVYDETYYVDSNFDFATVFYKGHSTFEDDTCHPYYHYYLYDDDYNYDSDSKIYDIGIGDNMFYQIHDFVFLWTCSMANEQGEEEIGEGHWRGMSAAWIQQADLRLDSHDDPDPNNPGHCFIGFYSYSKPFRERTDYLSYRYADFVNMFYYYATIEEYTIDDALDQAALDCLGSYLENSELYTGYSFYHSQQQQWYYGCKIRIFGDGNMTLT